MCDYGYTCVCTPTRVQGVVSCVSMSVCTLTALPSTWVHAHEYTRMGTHTQSYSHTDVHQYTGTATPKDTRVHTSMTTWMYCLTHVLPHIGTHVHVGTATHRFTHPHKYSLTQHTCTRVHAWTTPRTSTAHMYTQLHTCTSTYVHAHACTHIHTCTTTDVHAHITAA